MKELYEKQSEAHKQMKHWNRKTKTDAKIVFKYV
jgi:hypothetical protein